MQMRKNKEEGQYYALLLKVRCVFSTNPGSLTIDVPPSETTRWRAVSRVLRSPLDALFCVVYPSGCTLCGDPLPQFSVTPICDSCWSEMSSDAAPSCLRCGDLLDTFDAALCRACRIAPPPFERAVSYGLYGGRLREAIHALKYGRMKPAAAGLGRMLAAAIAQLHGEAPTEMLVAPVPLHRRRESHRGFNQTRALARFALAALRKSHPGWRLTLAPRLMLRTRNTESQFSLHPHERRQNVRGAFRVAAPEQVRGRHILLIDDILTTGATARACAEALLNAGAESVRVATLARARRNADTTFIPDATDNPTGTRTTPPDFHLSPSFHCEAH